MRIKQPPRSKERNRVKYVNKHGVPTLNVQVIADDRGRFTWALIGVPGSNPDWPAYASSVMCHAMQLVAARFGYFLICDAGYPDRDELLIPWPKTELSLNSAKSNYNYYQSCARQPIECAFGRWERRWGVLWRRIEVDTAFASDVILATMNLHNLCMERNVAEPPPQQGFTPLARAEEPPVGRPPAPRDESLRQRITRAVAEAGLTRAPLPSGVHGRQEVDGVVG